MTLTALALRNTFRNRTRAGLTIAGVAVLTLAFVFLRTVIGAFNASAAEAHTDRLVVRNRVSLGVPLPLADLEKIQAVPGVGAVTYSNWFGGIYLDQRHFFPRFAVDPATYFQVFKNVTLGPGEFAAFQADRTGCLVGSGIAKRYGFKKGDVIHLKGDIYPGDFTLNVDGVFQTESTFADTSLFFQWKYLDQSLPEARRGKVGVFELSVSDPARSPAIAKSIDALFSNSANETLTESEQAFMLGFLTGSKAIIDALQAVSFVLLFIMLLILGNTLAMAVRERTSELAVLRTFGFRPSQLLGLALAEGFWLGLLGGIAGVLGARPILGAFLRVAGTFIGSKISDRWTVPSVGLAVAMGLFAAALPAIQASRVDIVSALRRAE